MGAADMNKTQLNKVVKIEAWAFEMAYKHRRECDEKVCGGKSKMWWIVRHPRISPEIATPEQRRFVATHYHVCMSLLERLESGRVPWLPRERPTYAKRSADRILELLGRVEASEPEPEDITEEDLTDPMPGVRESFPETLTEIRNRARLESARRRETRAALPGTDQDPAYDADGRSTDRTAYNGLAGTVAALSRKG